MKKSAAEEIIAEVGYDPELDDKNTDALLKHPTLEKQPFRSRYESLVYPLLEEKVQEFIDPDRGKGTDINTVLRELQDEAESAIQEAQHRE